jgi:4-hydroxybenzoate polyprenyltransferase
MNLNLNRNNKKIILPQFVTTIQDEMIYGGYFAAFAGPAFLITVSILTKTNVNLPLLIISFLIPLMVYSYDYYKDMDKDMESNLERAMHYNKKSKIYPYLMIIYISILTILLIFYSSLEMMLFILVLVMVGVLYTVGLKKFTKKIPAFKNIYTTLTWSLAGTFSIPFYYSLHISLSYILIFLCIFLKFLPNTIFFDLKDINSDQKDELKTLPVLLGKERTFKLLHRLNIIAFIPLFIGIYLKVIPLFAVILILFYFYSVYYINKAKKSDDKELRMVSHTLADGEFVILWPLLLIITKTIGL